APACDSVTAGGGSRDGASIHRGRSRAVTGPSGTFGGRWRPAPADSPSAPATSVSPLLLARIEGCLCLPTPRDHPCCDGKRTQTSRSHIDPGSHFIEGATKGLFREGLQNTPISEVRRVFACSVTSRTRRITHSRQRVASAPSQRARAR